MEYYRDRRYYHAHGSEVREIFGYYYDDDVGTLVMPNADFEKGTLDGWLASGNAWGISNQSREGRIGNFHAESLAGGEQATGVIESSKFRITGRLMRFFLSGWSYDALRPNQCFLKDALTDEILRTASPPNQRC